MEKAIVNSSPPSSSQSTPPSHSPVTPGTNFTPELRRDGDKYHGASTTPAGTRGHGQVLQHPGGSGNLRRTYSGIGDDPFLASSLSVTVSPEHANNFTSNGNFDHVETAIRNDTDLGHLSLCDQLANSLNVSAQPRASLTSPWNNSHQGTTSTVTRYPRHGRFTHEFRVGQEGWVSRVVDLTFTSDWTFKSCVENLRNLVPELEKCSYVRYGRQGQNHVYIIFDDLRDAEDALHNFQDLSIPLRTAYDVGFVPYAVYNNECRTTMTPFSGFETQVDVEVKVNLDAVPSNMVLFSELLDLACKKLPESIFECGDWRTIEWSRNSALKWSLKVEFHSAEHAARFLDKYIDGKKVSLTPKGECFMHVTTMQPPEALQSMRIIESEKTKHSRYIRTAPQPRVASLARAEDSSNQIDPVLIEIGRDVRVTVMLRNIPNRMNCTELKAFLDQSCRYKYDFLYLRIDFENDCNVGYAFINFTAPEYVKVFYEKVHGYTWELAGSSKTASLCYATTQGKEALVERFRNSCVSQKLPWMRPHLYISSHDWSEYMEEFPRKREGDELPFPHPNNLNKLHRSMAIADEQGLFHNKDKRSGADLRGYDRGNPNNFGQLLNTTQSSGAIGTRIGNGSSAEAFIHPMVAHEPTPWELSIFRPPSMLHPTSILANPQDLSTRRQQNGTISPHRYLRQNIRTPSVAQPLPFSTDGFGSQHFNSEPLSYSTQRSGLSTVPPRYIENEHQRGFNRSTSSVFIGRDPAHQHASAQSHQEQNEVDDSNLYNIRLYTPNYTPRFRY